MLKKKKILCTAGALALCALLTTACVSSNASPTSEKYENPFFDVKDSDWFSADVQYANENGLMNGTSDTSFLPNDTTTRGMLVTILWRLDGQSDASRNNAFTDVEKDKYYYDAVSWASENKIVSGYSDNQFAPNDNMTREQLAAVLYRYANYKKYDISGKADLSAYKDENQISDYAVDAFKWANADGIITGTSSNTLEPKGNAQRAQIASILRRFCEKYAGNKTDTAIGENTANSDIDTNKQNESPNSSGGVSLGNSNTSNDNQSEDNQNAIKIIPNTEPTIIVDSVTVKSGDSVQLIARIENNPGILGMTLTANYDESILTLGNVENGEAFNGILDLTTSKDLKSGSRFVWDEVDIADDDIKNGTMLIMNFKVLDSASAGSYPVSLTYAEGDIIDKNLSEVALQIVNGYIAVEN